MKRDTNEKREEERLKRERERHHEPDELSHYDSEKITVGRIGRSSTIYLNRIRIFCPLSLLLVFFSGMLSVGSAKVRR